jgi:alpha/beta superfamily hydrolase
LYATEGVKSPSAPGVLMTHGFSATIDMALDGYATVMADAGLAVLTYDHRHLGASDGEPRQLINPWRQTRDQIAALDWFAEQPEVDGGRLGVWGSSYSGGQALVLGAIDDRVRAVVANVPFVGGFASDVPIDERFVELSDALLNDSGNGPADATDEPVGPVAVVNEPGSEGRAFMGQPSAAEWFLDVGRRTGVRWQNQVWLQRAVGSVPSFDPGVCIPHLRAAALFVVASEDDVANTAAELRAFEAAPDPKELVMIEGDHFTPYSGDALAKAATAARDWFLHWL